MKNIIKKYFEKNNKELSDYIVRILTEMVAEKTVNVPKENMHEHPYLKIPGDETKVAKIVARELQALGLEYKIHEMTEGRANIICNYGEKNTPSLLVASHMDIVPAGDGWTTDPFKAYVKDGKIFGRGVLDNKGPLASTLATLKAFKECGIKLKGQFILAGIASEEHRESGETDPGLEYLMKEKLLTPQYAIIPDIGENMEKIDIAEKGRLGIKVTATGIQAHGSTPERGVNAILIMSEFLERLKKFEMKFKPHDYLIKPTLNVGTIKGGSAPNIVPGLCDAVLDIRYLPGQSAEGILQELKTLIKGMAHEGKIQFSFEDPSIPHQVDADNILVKLIQANSKNIINKTPVPFGMGGGTFAKSFNLAGIQAVGFGPGDDDAFHVANEYVEIKQLVDFAHLIGAIGIDLLN